MTGAARVAKAAPDGYQFVLGNVGTHAQNQTLYKNPSYHAAADFAPVGLLVDLPMMLVTRTTLPPNNLPEFIAYAKANQDKMQYGSAGTGAPTHLACALFNVAIGVKITHVPYRGSAQALQDMIGGRIDYHASTRPPPFRTSKARPRRNRDVHARALADLSDNRDHAGAGAEGFCCRQLARFLPAQAHAAAIVRKLHDASVAALNNPAVVAQLKKVGADVVAPERRSPEYLQEFVESEIQKWAVVVKAAGVSAD